MPRNRSDEVEDQDQTVDPMMVLLARMTSVLERLEGSKGAPDTTDIKELVKQMTQQNARHILPSNARNEDGRSWQRPKGEHHPDYEHLAFHRQPIFNGYRVSLLDLSVDEIDAYNDLSKSLPRAGSQRHARGGTWRAWVSENDAELRVSLPCHSIEDRAEWNGTPLVFLLREFVDGERIDQAAMYQELLAMKARLAELTAAQPV